MSKWQKYPKLEKDQNNEAQRNNAFRQREQQLAQKNYSDDLDSVFQKKISWQQKMYRHFLDT